MRMLTRTGVFAAAAAVTVMATAGSALATGDYNAKLHQEIQGETPIAAADWEQGDCPDWIGADQDGWHFVVPGQGEFVKLKVQFENAGWVKVDTFGPPSDKHAYVATEPGDQLLSGKAVLDGGKGTFNLSHTCAAEDETDPTDPTDDPTDPTDDPTDPTDDPTDPTDPADDPTDPADDPTDPADDPTDPADPADDPTDGVGGGTTPDGDGTDLANTGSSMPVIALSLGAAALLGAGGYLVVRRRNAAAQA